MSGAQPYRERDRGGDRDPAYRSGYNNRGGGGGGGGFRGRGGVGGYKPRRYWDSDDYYKDDRDHGRGRRRRSYSRSRSRSRSYSSRSRSRSRTPTRRGRSRSPPRPEEVTERPLEQGRHDPKIHHEPYVPTKEPSAAWSNSRMQLPQEYITQTNGQAPVAHNQMNPYGVVDTAYPSHYQEGHQTAASLNNPPPMGYTYGQSTNMMSHPHYQPQQPPPSLMFPHGGVSQPSSLPPPPPTLVETKLTKDDGSSEGSKKKKDKRKKKKRHHSSSSSSSSSDDSSESRRRHKSKKNQGSSDSSSEDEKKESTSSSGLTTAQKDALLKQREGYQTKLEILEREISKLQSKEDELIRSRADRQLIDENLKLQAELKGRCKAVLIVLEKIDDVLKVGNKPQAAPAEKPRIITPQETPVVPSRDSLSHQPLKVGLPSSEPINSGSDLRKGSFDYFDNGQHWCRLCNVFPETVEQMLTHFHSKEHHDQIQQLGIDEKPWHKRNSVTDAKPVLGARKAPFRGMQFFSPVEGWYCRLCNSWMGDPHCAVEHLKSDDHNSNYMNFLEEHPDWEHKWVSDRERALGASGKQDSTYLTKKSRFDDSRSTKDVKEKLERKPVSQQEDLDSGKSIRVQMRNSLKGEDRGNVSHFSTAPLNEVPATKDSGLEEWMSKPKVTVDIIDAQKFAAIVRQKHGTKDKEVKDGKGDLPDVKPPLVAPPSSQKEKDYKKEKDDRRRPDKVELQISNRDKDRDRYRDRDSRGSRRRSRSRSRSRSRDRRYNRRRSRSRSRSRDRSDRDRRDRGGDRERPEFKEAVKKLPMIGKMPLYKRPVINREKPELERSKAVAAEVSQASMPPVRFLPKETVKIEPENISMYNENSGSAYMYDAHSSFDHGSANKDRYSVPPVPYGQVPVDAALEEDTKDFQHVTEMHEDVPSDELKEGKEDTPAALPDDFQQALDIIYAANTAGTLQKPNMVPQPVPPPGSGSLASSTNGVTDEPSQAVAGSTEYGDYSANGYANYMGYQPYQQSFDGYAPVGYEELDDGPPGVGDENPSAGVAKTSVAVPHTVSETEKVTEKDPPPPGDDDMDDLRMLGIDVDDTAVVLKHP